MHSRRPKLTVYVVEIITKGAGARVAALNLDLESAEEFAETFNSVELNNARAVIRECRLDLGSSIVVEPSASRSAARNRAAARQPKRVLEKV